MGTELLFLVAQLYASAALRNTAVAVKITSKDAAILDRAFFDLMCLVVFKIPCALPLASVSSAAVEIASAGNSNVMYLHCLLGISVNTAYVVISQIRRNLSCGFRVYARRATPARLKA